MVPEKIRDCDLTDLAEKKMILARLRAIGRALDRAERQEGANGKSN